MVAKFVRSIMLRDLRALCAEIEAYEDEKMVWHLVPGVVNSPGTLTLHIAGNLQHYIGAKLGSTGYVRDRDSEFSRRDVPRAELLQEVEEAIAAVDQTLSRLPDTRLADEFPEAVGGLRVTTGDFLIHLAGHLGYHLGQVDYHRRILTGQSTTVGALALTGLSSARPIG